MLVGVATTNYSSGSSSDQGKMVQMNAVLGREPFSLLNEDAKSTLFSEFVTKYSKKVIS